MQQHELSQVDREPILSLVGDKEFVQSVLDPLVQRTQHLCVHDALHLCDHDGRHGYYTVEHTGRVVHRLGIQLVMTADVVRVAGLSAGHPEPKCIQQNAPL